VGDAAYLYMLLQGRETYGREHSGSKSQPRSSPAVLTPMEKGRCWRAWPPRPGTDQDIDIQYTPEELWALEQMAGKTALRGC